MFYIKKITLLIICAGILFFVAGTFSEDMSSVSSSGKAGEKTSALSERYMQLVKLNRTIRSKGPWLSPSEVDSISYAVFRTSNKYSVEPELVLAVMQTESGFKPSAVSYRGALGLMQIMPSTARYLAKELELGHIDNASIHNTNLNVELGTYYISKLKRQFGDLDSVLLAYNYGPSRYASSIREGKRLVNSYPQKVRGFWPDLD